MCNNHGYSQEEVQRYIRLGAYSARILEGESLKDIAEKDGRPIEVVEEEFRGIRKINPYMYKQVFGED